jgi:hypothetical protein
LKVFVLRESLNPPHRAYGVDLIFLLNSPQIKKSQIKDGKLNFVFQIKFYINKKDITCIHAKKVGNFS